MAREGVSKHVDIFKTHRREEDHQKQAIHLRCVERSRLCQGCHHSSVLCIKAPPVWCVQHVSLWISGASPKEIDAHHHGSIMNRSKSLKEDLGESELLPSFKGLCRIADQHL